MRLSFTDPHSRRWAIGATALICFVVSVFALQQASVQVTYNQDVSPKTKEMVEALVRGEKPMPEISAGEFQRRVEFATQRFGGTNTDRGRFYVSAGTPNDIETLPGIETWVYRTLGFSVTFSNVPQNPSGIPPGVAASRWIPLSPTSGIAVREPSSGPTGKGGHPVLSGTLMVQVNRVWAEVRLEEGVQTIPLGR